MEATGNFPVVATVLAVAGCFGEALLQKYTATGRAVQLALALGEAVPLGLLLRYFLVRTRNRKVTSDVTCDVNKALRPRGGD